MFTLTTPTQDASTAQSTKPIWLMELDWGVVVTRMCSYGTANWNGNVWPGGGFTVGTFDARDVPGSIVLADPDFTFRTLYLANGIRDRALRLWAAFFNALADDDPVPRFNGVCDSAEHAAGKLTIAPARASSGRAQTPRDRIGPAIGINFTSTPGEVVRWAGQSIVMVS